MRSTQANDHDEIVVDPGVLRRVQSSICGASRSRVRSQDPMDPDIVVQTVLFGSSDSIFYGHLGEEPDTVISGFVLTGANTDIYGAMALIGSSPTISSCAFQWNGAANGAGIALGSSNAIIVDCAFTHGSADHGGGIYATESSQTIRNCTFDRNSATLDGGGIYLYESAAVIERCRFVSGTASQGGGIYAELSQITVAHGHFSGNAFDDTGGGIFLDDASSATIEDCKFVSARGMSGSGGGLAALRSSDMTVRRSTFLEHSTATGGAILVGLVSTATIVDCRIEHNSADYAGGGIEVSPDSSVTLQGTVVCGNSPDQIYGPYIDNGGNALNNYVPPPAPIAEPCPEDINGDGVVDLADLGALLAMFGQPCP
jgi:hypothetical protein